MTDIEIKKEEQIVIDSFAERRRVRESLAQTEGVNIYGGQRCVCRDCGSIHWKPREDLNQE